MPREPDHPQLPPLEADQEKNAEEESSLDARTTLEVVRREGERELERSTRGLAWSALAAGLSMGFSFVAQALLHAHLPEAEWRPLVSKLGYAAGFLIVILGSQQLFTENTLSAIVPLLAKRTRAMLRNVARMWAVVLAANLLGTLAFAIVIARLDVFDPHVHQAFRALGDEAMRHGFGTTLLRGVFAGWLIALMVWMLPAAQTSHFWVILVITWLVGVGGFPHIIAGAAETFYMAVAGHATWAHTVGGWIVPTLIGNSIGGVAFVSALNTAQVVAGEETAG